MNEHGTKQVFLAASYKVPWRAWTIPDSLGTEYRQMARSRGGRAKRSKHQHHTEYGVLAP
jgi:hypothetical protein